VLEARNKNQRKPSSQLMSYTQSFYHIVFRTYHSEPTIPIEHDRELYAYIYGIARNLNCQTYRIGGMPYHVHIFVSLPPTLPVASFVQRRTISSVLSARRLRPSIATPHCAPLRYAYVGLLGFRASGTLPLRNDYNIG
jgi:REP element-mobilizing transposase RayT